MSSRRFGLYLADLRRSATDSHGIINHAIGLTRSLSVHLEASEELYVLLGKDIAGELPGDLKLSAKVDEIASPRSARERLWLDHVAVRRWSKERDLDVVHFPKGHIPVAWRNRAALVATVHDDIPIRYLKQNLLPIRQRLKMAYFAISTVRALRSSDAVITDSQFSARSLGKHVPSASPKFRVIPSAVSLPLLSPVEAERKARTLVMLGSALPHKRTSEAVGWTRRFLDEHPDYRLVVTGRLSAAGELACRHPRIERRSRVLSNLEMAELLRSSSALLFPSVLEGFGLPPVEAVCLGTPVVWANGSSLTEVMGSAPGAFIPDDENSFLDALEKVLCLGTSELGSLARGFQEKYSWIEIGRQTLEIYRALERAS
jgi:glycosyltransferase involved in cell wall biosynthesis